MNKTEQAIELLIRHPKRSDFIAAAKEQFQLTDAGAATYYMVIKRIDVSPEHRQRVLSTPVNMSTPLLFIATL